MRIPGQAVYAKLVPADDQDQYPTHDPFYGLGGFRTVATLAARDAIPAFRRELGMVVHVNDAQPDTAPGVFQEYKLIGGLLNANWFGFDFTGSPVATVAALRLFFSNYSSASADIRCHTLQSAGGGGRFILDLADTTTADNNGTVIVDAIGRRWKRDTRGKVSVADFGAVPNDVTYADTNRRAASRMMQWCDLSGDEGSMGGFGVYWWEPGTSNNDVTGLNLRGIDVRNKSGLKISGSGWGTIWKLNPEWFYRVGNLGSQPDAHLFFCTNTNNHKFSDFQIDGSALELQTALSSTLAVAYNGTDSFVTLVSAARFTVGKVLRVALDSGVTAQATITAVVGNVVSFVGNLGGVASLGAIAIVLINEQMHGFYVTAGSNVFGGMKSYTYGIHIHDILFNNIRGDGIFTLGELVGAIQYTVSDLLCDGCTFFGPYANNLINKSAGRSGTAHQRNVENIRIINGFYYGITDAPLDAEATGNSPNRGAQQFVFNDNTIIQTSIALAVSPGGLDGTQPMTNLQMCRNLLIGGSMRTNDVLRANVSDNVIIGGVQDPAFSAINFTNGLHLCNNVMVEGRTVATDATILLRGSGSVAINKVTNAMVSGNTAYSNVTLTSGGLRIENPGSFIAVVHNTFECSAAANGAGISVVTVTPETGVKESLLIEGNVTKRYATGINLNAYNSDNVTLTHVRLIANAAISATTGITLSCTAGTPQPFPFLTTLGNTTDGATATSNSTGGRQTTILVGGNFGGNSARYTCTSSPEGVVTAPIGALATLIAGTAATGITFQKRTGTGNTGWKPLDGFTGSASFNPPSLRSNRYTGSSTYDPPSLATGAETTTDVTVTGARLGTGDTATASFSLNTLGIKLTANVIADNTVRVTFRNDTGGTLDLASGTLSAIVLSSAASSTTTTVTVAGAVLGDMACPSFSLSTQGIELFADITATDTATVTFVNATGATLDLNTGTLKVKALAQ